LENLEAGGEAMLNNKSTLFMSSGVVLIATSIFAYGQTSKLDAPISTKPTIRTEIKRGEAAAFDCGLQSVTDYSAFTTCINAVEDSNQQKNTKSEPFMLGLSIEALAQAQIINPSENSGWVSIWRKNTAQIIKAYKLTDADLCAAFDMKCEVVKRVVSQAK
jgi:hypothetical protein